MKIGLKNWVVWEIGVKLHVQCLSEGREMTSGLSYWEVQKIEGSRNWDSTVRNLLSF